MENRLVQHAQEYAVRHRLQLAERLGYGIHGIIFAAKGNPETGEIISAIKVHREKEPYVRELAAYCRLKQAGIKQILNFSVPQFRRHDSELLIIEMSIVTRPFVLDFAGAYLHEPPEFSEEIWDQWEKDKREQFEERWPQVQVVLYELEKLDIHMVDVTPTNIAFQD